MVARAKLVLSRHRRAVLAAVVLVALVGVLAGWRSTVGSSRADSDAAEVQPTPGEGAPGCTATVVETLSRVLLRAYREGVASERTLSAQHLIAGSAALRQAVEANDPQAARTAAQALLATGHMTNLLVTRGAKTLVRVGGPALTPIEGAIVGVGGTPIAHYLTSVWADEGFVAEGQGIAQGFVSIRVGGHSVGGSLTLPAGELPVSGTLTRHRVAYQFTSFAAQAYPAGQARVYLLIPVASAQKLCGASAEDTTVNTLTRVANLIYEGEAGRRTLAQVQRVQSDQALLAAVAARDRTATRLAVEALLHHHLVRLRVSAGGQVLEDDGGPYVLAPVTAPLRLHGRQIGSIVLSIQDDEGYKRLAGRLAGLDVLMYMHDKLVKNSLGPAPGKVPASGAYSYRGRSFRVFTVDATAFPSGPLTIRVLVPVPYA
jgi:hypothetical protein